MAGGAAQVYQASLCQQDDALAVREDDMIDLGFDFLPLVIIQRGYVDFVVEMADIADDGLVLHGKQVLMGDHVVIAGGRDEDIRFTANVVHLHHPVTFHSCLQGADGVHLGDADRCAETAQRLRTTLAHVAVTEDHRGLAGDHDIGGALDAVNQGLPAAVQVVELGLGNGIVHVDGRKR